MTRSRLRILVYLASEVLILLGAFFIASTTSGPFSFPIVLVLSLLAPALLILTRVRMLEKPVGMESEKKVDIKVLCEHLRQIGLDATVESKQPSRFRTKMFAATIVYGLIFSFLFIGFFFASFLSKFNWAMAIRDPVGLVSMLSSLFGIFFILPVLWLVFFPPQPSSPDSYVNYSFNSPFMGSVRVASRNIDLIELQWRDVNVRGGEFGEIPYQERWYGCNYVVQTKIEGLENKLKAETKPFTEGVVDIVWKGGELAQALNKDANLRDQFYQMKTRDKEEKIMKIEEKYEIPDMSSEARRIRDLFLLNIRPDRKHECVRITLEGGYVYPEYAFPTIETFEAFDRIGYHIRRIANIRP